MFQMPYPGFNIKGEDSVSTRRGFICSVIFFLLWGAFALIKFGHLITHHNPTISTAYYPNEYDATKKLNLRELNNLGMQFAIGLESYWSQESLALTDYVKF